MNRRGSWVRTTRPLPTVMIAQEIAAPMASREPQRLGPLPDTSKTSVSPAKATTSPTTIAGVILSCRKPMAIRATRIG